MLILMSNLLGGTVSFIYADKFGRVVHTTPACEKLSVSVFTLDNSERRIIVIPLVLFGNAGDSSIEISLENTLEAFRKSIEINVL